jgi:hypothetical protein
MTADLVVVPDPAVVLVDVARYVELDAEIDNAEDAGIRARWQFGRTLLMERVGKKLPKGRLDAIAAEIGKSRSEIKTPMRFASRFDTESALDNAVVQYGSWHEIVNDALSPGAHVGNNSGDNEWYSPEPFPSLACEVMGGIDLDPASTAEANAVVQAKEFYTKEQNGLRYPWAGRVWMNPPYATELIGQFCDKLVEEYSAGNVEQAITLTNNSTETIWFHCLAEVGAALCFPRRRVEFWHPRKESSPLQGQAVIYLGENVEAFRDAFDPAVGVVFVRSTP